MRQASGLAREGAGTIGAAQRRVIYAVQDAHNAGFNVEEDLSVTDTRTSRTFAEQAARQAQAQALAGDIRQRATQLIGVEHEVAAKIATATAPLNTVGFHEPPIAPSLPTPVPHNEKPQIHAVDRSWKQDPPSPMPGDPKDMTAVQARAAWDAVNADIARYNARCGRTFVLPNEQAAYDACIADKGSLFERQAAIRARCQPARREQPNGWTAQSSYPTGSRRRKPLGRERRRVAIFSGRQLPLSALGLQPPRFADRQVAEYSHRGPSDSQVIGPE